MIVNRIYEIDSCDDVELGIKRASKLEFKLCFDDEKEIEALFFIISGCGGDADSNYRDHLVSFAAKNFNVAVMSVNYHCVGNRENLGGKYYFDDIAKLVINESLKVFGTDLKVPDVHMDENMLSEELQVLNEIIESKKGQGKIAQDYTLDFPITIAPTKNEYQNFGIMQAQDLINALLYVKANPPFNVGGGICVQSCWEAHMEAI